MAHRRGQQRRLAASGARPDGSGFSDFAETYAQHKVNARRYQHRLDSLGVKR